MHWYLSRGITDSKNIVGTFEYLESIIKGFEKDTEKTPNADVLKTWISKLQDAQNSIKFGYQMFALLFVVVFTINGLVKFIANITNISISQDIFLSLWMWVSLCISLWIFNAIVEKEIKTIFGTTNINMK